MGAHTTIEWTDSSLNFWEGCTKVSDGCRGCYAETMAKRWGKGHWGPKAPRRPVNWRPILRQIQARAANGDVSRNGTNRLMVFVNDISDLFESPETMPAESRPIIEGLREECWRVIEANPQLIFQLLTKRPENVLAMIPEHWRAGLPTNVWVGTSAERQDVLDRRIVELGMIPATVRFLSLEPLLADIELLTWLASAVTSTGRRLYDWCVTGGESGPGARPMDVEWVREILRACRAHNIPAFTKQLGAKPFSVADRISHRNSEVKMPGGFYRYLNDKKGGDPAEWPEDLRVREFPAVVR